jgi:hypothetical protein
MVEEKRKDKVGASPRESGMTSGISDESMGGRQGDLPGEDVKNVRDPGQKGMKPDNEIGSRTPDQGSVTQREATRKPMGEE